MVLKNYVIINKLKTKLRPDPDPNKPSNWVCVAYNIC